MQGRVGTRGDGEQEGREGPGGSGTRREERDQGVGDQEGREGPEGLTGPEGERGTSGSWTRRGERD